VYSRIHNACAIVVPGVAIKAKDVPQKITKLATLAQKNVTVIR
jgi:hypothetical protein